MHSCYSVYSTSKEVMQLMMKWVHKYLDQTGEQGLNADIAHHGTFYSVCQSAIYIFCFKHNDFMQMKRGNAYIIAVCMVGLYTICPLLFSNPDIFFCTLL